MDSKPVCSSSRVHATLNYIDKKLVWWQNSDALTQVIYSPLVTFIIEVKTTDGSVRLPTVFFTRLANRLDTHEHPLHTLVCFLSSIRETFSKIDLSNVYRQTEADDTSMILLTINAHTGFIKTQMITVRRPECSESSDNSSWAKVKFDPQ